VILARIFDAAQFGTYKQLFLVWSTVFYIAQVGMSQSLYYFFPRAPRNAGAYAANSVSFLGLAGLFCLAAVTAGASQIARWLSNPQLTAYLPWIGLYLLFMMLSSALEIVMISRGRYGWASASYAASDLLRAAAFILPVLWFGELRWLLIGAVLAAGVRVVATIVYFSRSFGATFRPDGALLRTQLSYALPSVWQWWWRHCRRACPIRGVAPI
jgi:O-antigen/teichoic acid export membrane protein